MADGLTVEGMEEIRKKLESLKDKGGRRILKAALRAAVNEIGKEMRRQLPANVKEGRTAIRGLVKGTKRVTAKVGVHVGKGRARQQKNNTPTKGGVGIGAPNVHWWIRGTKDRYRGQKRRASAGVARPGKSLQPTGRMPGFAEGLAMRAAIKAAPAAQRSMAMRAKKQFDKEIAKQLIRS